MLCLFIYVISAPMASTYCTVLCAKHTSHLVGSSQVWKKGGRAAAMWYLIVALFGTFTNDHAVVDLVLRLDEENSTGFQWLQCILDCHTDGHAHNISDQRHPAQYILPAACYAKDGGVAGHSTNLPSAMDTLASRVQDKTGTAGHSTHLGSHAVCHGHNGTTRPCSDGLLDCWHVRVKRCVHERFL